MTKQKLNKYEQVVADALTKLGVRIQADPGPSADKMMWDFYVTKERTGIMQEGNRLYIWRNVGRHDSPKLKRVVIQQDETFTAFRHEWDCDEVVDL